MERTLTCSRTPASALSAPRATAARTKFLSVHRDAGCSRIGCAPPVLRDLRAGVFILSALFKKEKEKRSGA